MRIPSYLTIHIYTIFEVAKIDNSQTPLQIA